jgi:hypothetical protein
MSCCPFSACVRTCHPPLGVTWALDARGDTGYAFGEIAILVRLPLDDPQVYYRSARSVPVDASHFPPGTGVVLVDASLEGHWAAAAAQWRRDVRGPFWGGGLSGRQGEGAEPEWGATGLQAQTLAVPVRLMHGELAFAAVVGVQPERAAVGTRFRRRRPAVCC